MSKQHSLSARLAVTAALVLALGVAALGLSGGVLNVTGAPPLLAAPGTTHQIFIPMVRMVTKGISGQVTDQGGAASGIPIGLRFFDGTNYTIIMTATTTTSGVYWFQGVPGLTSGQRYSVRFDNPANTPNQLNYWQSPSIAKYDSGGSEIMDTFDVSDVLLGLPLNNAVTTHPVTFQWIVRSSSPTDSYILVLSDSVTNASFTTPPLGYVGTYTLTSLPPGFVAGDKMRWYIKIQSLDGGTGQSAASRTLTIN